ncbi:TPA: translation initiation factor IF-2 [Candidatus Saccharibacteria bacterium]|nr:translation initiation factor IF-2 [Candidatus Saccharibacteria bacterium]HRK41311.1 translation initiation factor IF-2 [Candidatus Saccharibacteria bacterium]
MAEKVLQVAETITVGELAEKLDLPVTKLVGELFKNGIAATVNQRIDIETAQIIVDELGLDVALEQKSSAVETAERQTRELGENASARPPIVAVMGHVDHGKTSLLDAILDTKVVEGEAGGITQHISAYQTIRNNRAITLLDTPGHEAFSALRQHGAALTDVVIIVVAADDGVKPQTVEAIKFAQSANAKIVVALTKVDKDTANVERVKSQLASEYNMNPEEWGGDTVMVEVSSKTGHNLDKLLDLVLLVADLEELRADTDVPAEGLVIESHMETGKGPVVSVLVQHGELKPGQFVVSGTTYAKVRTQLDYAGRPLAVAGPSTPATITGFKEVPSFGDQFLVVKNEKAARAEVQKNRLSAERDKAQTNVTGTDLLRMMNKQAESQDVNVIVKADVQGSLTSVTDSLKLLENEELIVRIIGSGIGSISENDVRLAASSGAVIYGFNVQLPPAVKRLAARDKVSVRIFKVIYELLDDIRVLMEDMLSPEVVETETGELKILGVFRTTKESVICGGEVLKGKVVPGTMARLKRDKEFVAEVEVTHVQRQQQEAKEVFEGEQCGLELKTTGKLLVEEGDRLEFFTRELKKRTLA